MLAQFVRFSLVGVLNTAVHYAVFYTLYRLAGVHHLLASGLGFCIAVVNSYVCNKFWTFRQRGAPAGREFGKFFLVSLLALGVNLAGMAILVELLDVAPPLAQLLTIVLTLVVNFLGNRYWTFEIRR